MGGDKDNNKANSQQVPPQLVMQREYSLDAPRFHGEHSYIRYTFNRSGGEKINRLSEGYLLPKDARTQALAWADKNKNSKLERTTRKFEDKSQRSLDNIDELIFGLDADNIDARALPYSLLSTTKGECIAITDVELGRGSFGRVKLGQNLNTKEFVAVKVFYDSVIDASHDIEIQNIKVVEGEEKIGTVHRRDEKIADPFALFWKTSKSNDEHYKAYNRNDGLQTPQEYYGQQEKVKTDASKTYLIMSWVAGTNLQGLLHPYSPQAGKRTHKKQTVIEKIDLALEYVAALEKLHAPKHDKHYVHGDLGPNNFIVNNEKPTGEKVTIIDYASMHDEATPLLFLNENNKKTSLVKMLDLPQAQALLRLEALAKAVGIPLEKGRNFEGIFSLLKALKEGHPKSNRHTIKFFGKVLDNHLGYLKTNLVHRINLAFTDANHELLSKVLSEISEDLEHAALKNKLTRKEALIEGDKNALKRAVTDVFKQAEQAKEKIEADLIIALPACYRAPELNKATQAADRYSLGIVLATIFSNRVWIDKDQFNLPGHVTAYIKRPWLWELEVESQMRAVVVDLLQQKPKDRISLEDARKKLEGLREQLGDNNKALLTCSVNGYTAAAMTSITLASIGFVLNPFVDDAIFGFSQGGSLGVVMFIGGIITLLALFGIACYSRSEFTEQKYALSNEINKSLKLDADNKNSPAPEAEPEPASAPASVASSATSSPVLAGAGFIGRLPAPVVEPSIADKTATEVHSHQNFFF